MRREQLHPGLQALAFTLVCTATLGLGPSANAAFGPETCGSLQNAYGPVDFRTAEKAKITIVTDHHFTSNVEFLIKGNASYLGGDLDYTLRAIPNHPRALVSMMRFGERLQADQVPHAKYPVECYFERAVRFRPEDTTVRMLFATFLNKKQRKDEALFHLRAAQKAASDNPFTHYNLGLVFFEMGEFELSADAARSAQSMGFPRTDLIDRLKGAGKWVDAPTPPASSPQ